MDKEALDALVDRNLTAIGNRNLSLVDISSLIAYQVLDALGRPELVGQYTDAVVRRLEKDVEAGTGDRSLLFNREGGFGSDFK